MYVLCVCVCEHANVSAFPHGSLKMVYSVLLNEACMHAVQFVSYDSVLLFELYICYFCCCCCFCLCFSSTHFWLEILSMVITKHITFSGK